MGSGPADWILPCTRRARCLLRTLATVRAAAAPLGHRRCACKVVCPSRPRCGRDGATAGAGAGDAGGGSVRQSHPRNYQLPVPCFRRSPASLLPYPPASLGSHAGRCIYTCMRWSLHVYMHALVAVVRIRYRTRECEDGRGRKHMHACRSWRSLCARRRTASTSATATPP